MGPTLLESTAPLLSKGKACQSIAPSSGGKKAKARQNHGSQKVAGSQPKRATQTPAREAAPAFERSSRSRGRGTSRSHTPYLNDTSPLRRVQALPPLPQSVSPCLRPALSLPLSPLRPRLYQPKSEQQHQEEDIDSASDLSDSERLPIPPSPCTPPQLNLRAEVIDPNDLQPCLPGPSRAGSACSNYPDFLPPPFCNWSLRQLALFLHTEGRGAPRPKPVGPLERYLERLLQLEWLQIQTIQSERSRAHPQTARAHPLPPARLSSPQSSRRVSPQAFPVSPHATCPSCRIRYPFCSGSYCQYAYQQHSRLSPVLERRAQRSSSESRATLSSPQMDTGHIRQAQTPATPRSPSQGAWPNTRARGSPAVACRPKETPSTERSRAGVGRKGGKEKHPSQRAGGEPVKPPAGVAGRCQSSKGSVRLNTPAKQSLCAGN